MVLMSNGRCGCIDRIDMAVVGQFDVSLLGNSIDDLRDQHSGRPLMETANDPRIGDYRG